MIKIWLLIIIISMTSFSKSNQKPKVKRTLIFSMEEQIIPGVMDDYIETTKKWIDTIKKLNLDMTFVTFGNYNGNLVEYNQQIATMADIGFKIENWNKAREILTGTEWGRKRLSLISKFKYSVWQSSPEISYQPIHPNPSQLTYFVWNTLLLKKPMENNFIETGKKIRTLFDEYNIDRGYTAFQNIIGYEDTYVVIFAGKNSAEFYDWQQQTWAKLAQQLKPLLNQLATSVKAIY